MSYTQRYAEWLENPAIDEEVKKELREIAGNEKEIEDRFFKDLEFGTAGLRGIIGAGTNRMNKYIVGKATQGISNFLKKQGKAAMERGVAIAYDSRNMSPEFAEYTALTLAGNGIKAYVFDELRPVPELSFAVRHLNCAMGIAITASHNPPEYNGYKVYGEDGAQVCAPNDKLIMDEVIAVTDLSEIKFAVKEEAERCGLFNVIGEEIDKAYLEKVIEQVQDIEALKENAKNLKIIYTPLHGTGNKPVRNALKMAGFENVFVVKEQEAPDGNFTTVGSPNPENAAVFELAIKLAEKENADIVVATDPDADRVGAVVKNEKGEYIVITGNMSGTLLTHFILDTKSKKGRLPENAVVIKTIVSTGMADVICNDYGAEIMEVLTGFKYIGEKIKEFETSKQKTFIFGFEESYGCLAGTYARDKDAILATVLLCELAAKLKAEGKTLYEGLNALYQKYGYFKEEVVSVTLAGASGARKMAALMDTLRQSPPAEIGGEAVSVVNDYKLSQRTYINEGTASKMEEILLPKSDVLKLELSGGSWFCVRPSGTEPKIKFYAGVKAASPGDASMKIECIASYVKEITENI